MRTTCKALDKGEEDDVMAHLEWMRYGLVTISSGQQRCQSNPYRLDQKELDVDDVLAKGTWKSTRRVPTIWKDGSLDYSLASSLQVGRLNARRQNSKYFCLSD